MTIRCQPRSYLAEEKCSNSASLQNEHMELALPAAGTTDRIRSLTATLHDAYAGKLVVNPDLTRQLVSFQANKQTPVYRWFKYKEGFSAALIEYILDKTHLDAGVLLDPFAGAGTTVFVASGRDLDAVGIELLPVGYEVMKVRKAISNGGAEKVRPAVKRWLAQRPWRQESEQAIIRHLRITSGAYSEDTEASLARYLRRVEREEDPLVRRALRFAALCVLESISFTRKDGQYLRWDYRSGRRPGKNTFDKGKIYPFDEAIAKKLQEIYVDLAHPGDLFGAHPLETRGCIDLIKGSVLETLPRQPSETFDGIVTSPPYCNRYDYTRTYALELALLGVGEVGLKRLRQAMVSCTVENRTKQSGDWGNRVDEALEAFHSQPLLQAIIRFLYEEKAAKRLNNNGIPRMVKNYFLEMSLVLFECARVLKHAAPLVMVNDNVRYAGVAIPVDLILSEIARKAGFEIETIWVLPTGKGNSSQQMGRHGRTELRKCVYIWRKS